MTRLIILLLTFINSFVYAETLNTGNILTNSTFGTGETVNTTGWSTDSEHDIHTHGEWGFPYQTGMDDSGGVLAFEGHTEDNVYQDVDLVNDGHLTQSQINQGFTSTMSSDVWFWNNIENTFTLKQTITGSDGSVSTQIRNINDHDPNRSSNGGQFTNYTNVYTQGSNTQTDFTIRAEVYNETAGTNYDNLHRGPDVDNVTLNINYRDIPPIPDDIQEELNEIVINDDFINDIILDEIIWDFEEITFEDTIIEIEDLNFDEVIILDAIADFGFEEFDLTEFEEIDLDEIDFEEFEDIDFEELEEAIEEQPIEIIEEVEEETIDIEEEDKIEIAEEKTEEVIDDTVKEEATEGQGLLEEEIETVEDVTEIEEIESDEIEVANKDIKIDINDNITVDIKEITLFSNSNALEVYTKNEFYKPQQIYTEPNDGLFIQADLGLYYKNIYTGITLGNYIDADPISQHNKKLYDLKVQKLQILIDLKKLKGLL